MDNESIKAIERFVRKQSRELTEDIREQLNLYGVGNDGTLLPAERLAHLPEQEAFVARQLRQSVAHRAASMKRKDAVETVVREQVFTVLHRVVALRMAEEREAIPQTVSAGMQSEGFGVYLINIGSSSLGRFEWYREYLFAVLDELSLELPVLFDRYRAEGVLFPTENAFFALLEALNAPELAPVWREDETLGWVYQYFNDPAERKKMREKGAPADSYELAVRNQFFTPRYVVRFLVDNSLGRLWAETTGDRAALSDTAGMLALNPDDELSAQKPRDPRTLRVMDPACGSMHFGLYAFDLLAAIYADAWRRSADATWLRGFHNALGDEATLRREIPRLIIGENLLGIDIDRRAVQIAGLTLWLRAQRWWQEHGLEAHQRPQLERIRLATAQPMPGEDEFFEELAGRLKPGALGELLQALRTELELAGEVGSLLKIEERLEREIEKLQKARESYMHYEAGQQGLFPDQQWARLATKYGADVGGSESEWRDLENRLFAALREHVHRHTADREGYRHSLFADDTEAGIAFVDLLKERYDVVLMNPPFGAATSKAKKYLEKRYPRTKNDLYAAFVESFLHRLKTSGYLGAITSRTGFFLSSYTTWREEVLLKEADPIVVADLGFGVLDAMVETAAYVIRQKAVGDYHE